MSDINNALRRLDCVFAAADQGSLRQAARILRVRESSVSRNIVALEQFLNMQLFDRTAQGVRLTQAGAAWATPIRIHYEGLKDALTKANPCEHDAKTLRIGLSALGGRAFVAALLRRFKALHPHVNMVIADCPHEQVLQSIRRRQIDVAFITAPATISACASEVLVEERLFVLLPMQHALAERAAVSWHDLANERVLIPASQEGAGAQLALASPFGTDHGPDLEICVGNEATVVLKVQLGQGVTVAEESLAKCGAANATVWKPLEGQNSVVAVKAVWLDSNPKRALLRLLGIARKSARAQPGNMRSSWDGERTARR
ncbi:hypothetical protein CYK37_00345 [Mesorhizobium loti]|nr:LysR family transcriptional regulator [Mesorhizobium loti]PLP60804.1 hypothetical protein CYK37_00345 [Mesorhizobium loti]